MEDLKDQTNEEIENTINNKIDFDELKPAISKDKTNVTISAKIAPKKELPPSQFDNNLDRWLFICKDLPSPEIFLKFNFYFMVAACLNRKIWFGADDGNFSIFPNLYIILVSPPGVGKSLPTNVTNRILDSLVETRLKDDGTLRITKLLNLGPDAITFEKLIIRAASASDTVKLDEKRYYHHSSTTFCLGEELDMLFSENTRKVISFLMGCYNCGKFEGDWQKHGDILIDNVCINFFGCTTPETMKDLMKTKVLNSGFIGRALFIWGDKKRTHPPVITESEEQKNEQEYIKRHLRKLCKIKPQSIEFTPYARTWLDLWHYERAENHLNTHEKLLHYYARKKGNLIKLAINMAYSDKLVLDDNQPVTITPLNLEAAEKLLLSIEGDMHRALATSEDNPLSNLADKITLYLKVNGPCQKRKVYLDFYSAGDMDQIDKVIKYLIDCGVCKSEMVDRKDGIKIL